MSELYIQCGYFYACMPPEVMIITVPFEAEVNVSKCARLAKRASIALLGLGVLLLAGYFTPRVLAAVRPPDDAWVLTDKNLANMRLYGSGEKNLSYQPSFDPSLPLGSFIFIPKIGVQMTIYEDSYAGHEQALQKGAWRD
jgi:hypothetical protein